MENLYLCTVLMSAYNGANYIRQQIDSILSQKGVRVQLIIRDDGSSDGTIKILKEYEERFKDSVVVYYEKNIGIHKSFARLISYPGIEGFVAFSDQDDVWDDDKLFVAIKKIVSEDADFYCSSSRLVDSKLNYLGKTTEARNEYDHYQKGNNKILTPGVQGCTMVLTNSFFSYIVKKQYPDYYGHDTWLAVVAFYLYKDIYDEVPHMSYRQHNASWTGNRNNRFAQLKREYHFFMVGMNRYSKIAKDLLMHYSDDLKENDKKFLMLLAKSNKTIKEKLQLIFCEDFNKYGFLKNIVFKFEILKGNV